MVKLKDLVLLGETSKTDVLTDYFKDKITFEELVDMVGSLDKVASKKELQKFLDNNFLQDVMADTHGIDKRKLVDKVKNLLQKYK